MFTSCLSSNLRSIARSKMRLTVSRIIVNSNTHQYQRRSISDSDIVRSLKRTKTMLTDRDSNYDANMKTLIPMIQKGEYSKVKEQVAINYININSHDLGENTPLTDAAKRGDFKAVKFLIHEMNANVHASCACPHHKTALHYGAENGHFEIVEELLKSGALVNELDSRKYTALDVASTKEIKQLLTSNNGMLGSKIPFNQSQKLNLPKSNCLSLKNENKE